MATWIRQGTGTAPSATDADLVGEYLLDNATAPVGFDPAAVNSVRTQWTITGSGFTDDSWDDDGGCALVTSGGTEISQHPGGGPTGLQNTSESNDHTDSVGIPTGLSTAEWESARLRGDGTAIPNEWVTWVKNKGPDGSTLAVSAVTVTIDYTPDTGPQTLTPSTLSITPSFPTATIETPFVLPDWVRGWSRKIENGSSTTTTIVDKPTGVVEGDVMYAFNIHESGTMVSDTPPSGWAAVGTNPHAFGGGNAHVYKKTAGASEPSTYTFTYDPGNQMVTYIVAIKGDSYAIDAEQLSVVEDVDSDGGYEQTLTGIDSGAIGLFAITGNDPASATHPNYGSTSGMEKVDETSDVYLGAMAAWFVEDISGITSTTEVLTNADTIGNTMPILLVSVTPSSTTQNLTPTPFSITPSFPTATMVQEQLIEPTLLTISTTLPQHQLDQTFASNLVSLIASFGTSTIKEIQAIQPSLLSVALTLHAAQLDQNINASTHQVITNFGTSTLGLYVQSATLGVLPTLGNAQIGAIYEIISAVLQPTVSLSAAAIEGEGTTQDLQPSVLTVAISYPSGTVSSSATLEASVVALTASFGTATLMVGLQPALLALTPAFGSAQLDFGISDEALTIAPSFPTATLTGSQGLTSDTVNLTVVFPFGNLANAGTPVTPSDTEGQGIAQEMCAARSLPGDLDWLGSMNALANTNGKDKLGVLTALGATPGADLLLALEQLANDGQGPADFNELMRRWAESGNF